MKRQRPLRGLGFSCAPLNAGVGPHSSREHLIVAINIFEGSRRIALLAAGLATLGTLVVLVTNDPYVSIEYSVAQPGGPFSRLSGNCPSDAGKHYFTTETKTGQRLSIDLCLLTMPFGDTGEQLVPYKTDQKGMVWGAASYSSEVSEYERQLEKRFILPPQDDDFAEKEFSRRYWKEIKEGLRYLAIGLVVFGAFVWAVGWIVRGFLGIPRGMDNRPSEAQQCAQADGPASGGPAA